MPLLDRLTNLISSHTYYYVDDDKIKNKELNFFQKILRKFGYFEETHLRPLVERAYRISLRGNLKANQDEQKLLQLIYKANKTYDYHFELGEFISPGKYFLKATIQYQITKISASDTYNISAISLSKRFKGLGVRTFNIFKYSISEIRLFIRLSKTRDIRIFEIFKQLENKSVIKGVYPVCWKNTDSVHHIVQKILLDRPEVDAEFHYYCSKPSKRRRSPGVLPSFETSLVTAGWELADTKTIRVDTDTVSMGTISKEMQDYVMKKEAVKENGNYHTWEDKHGYSLNHALDLITPGNFKFPETRE
jgi:hypothetical protein